MLKLIVLLRVPFQDISRLCLRFERMLGPNPLSRTLLRCRDDCPPGIAKLDKAMTVQFSSRTSSHDLPSFCLISQSTSMCGILRRAKCTPTAGCTYLHMSELSPHAHLSLSPTISLPTHFLLPAWQLFLQLLYALIHFTLAALPLQHPLALSAQSIGAWPKSFT